MLKKKRTTNKKPNKKLQQKINNDGVHLNSNSWKTTDMTLSREISWETLTIGIHLKAMDEVIVNTNGWR